MRNILKFTLIIALVELILIGCVSQPSSPTNVSKIDRVNKTLEIQPVIDYYPLGGLTEKKGEGLYILPGNISTVKKGLDALVTWESAPRTTFSQDEDLNLVVFRGVFGTGGHGISINSVESSDNILTIHATYTDPGPGMMVTQAFTQPTAIIPIGKLSPGSYEVKLMVTWILKGERGDKILEENREHGSVAFEVN